MKLSQLALLFALPCPAVAQGVVHVVDADLGPGAAFATIHGALEVAADGDVILIRAGDYDVQVFLNDPDLSLELVAEKGELVRVARIAVVGLAAGEQIVLRGLSTLGNGTTTGFSVSGAAGEVWIEDCAVPATLAPSAFLVDQSDAVTLVRCSAVHNGGGAAVEVRDSRTALFDCDMQSVGASSHGLRLQDSTVTVSGGSFGGAPGADSVPIKCPSPSPGGSGIHVQGTGRVIVQDAQLTFGLGGSGAACGFADAPNGEPIGLGAGTPTFTLDPTPARSLTFTSPVRAGETTTLAVAGEAGDVILGMATLSPLSPLDLPFVSGPLVLDPPFRIFFRGTLPASGELSLDLQVGSLGGLSHVSVFAQPLALATGGALVLGAPSALLVLHPSL